MTACRDTTLCRLAKFILALALTLATSGTNAQPACPLSDIGTATAAAVHDGRTLVLSDGRGLRLAAIETPDSTRIALQGLVAGQILHLRKLVSEHDRYGRVVAFVYTGDAQQSVQQTLLAAGQARVSARVGDKTCANALLKAEREARAAHRGLWADPNFAPLPAENTPRLTGERGHFTLVEGRVLSVRESGGTLYLNFGRRVTRDFSAVVPRRLERSFAAAGIALKELAGRHIRVRGVIEQRRGPIIEVDGPEQIELIDEASRSREAQP
jgi:endonuclease YncB( thermonuclease family)